MKAVLLASALFLVGCAHDAERTDIAGHGVEVERLFEHDGVVVYRFSDGGNYHYYAVPRSGVNAIAFEDRTVCISTGKVTTCHSEHDDVPTVGSGQ